MDPKLRERIITAINVYTDKIFSDFFKEIKKDDKEILVDLAITLKSWANHYGSYTPEQNIAERADFKGLCQLLANPKTILYRKKFTIEDEKEILVLLRFK